MSRPFETVDSAHRFSIPLNMKLSVGIKFWLLIQKLPDSAVFTFTYQAFKTDTPNTTQLLASGFFFY